MTCTTSAKPTGGQHPEYVVWRVIDQAIDGSGCMAAYVPVAPDERGVIESAVFPGLLSVPAMLAGDRPAILAAGPRPCLDSAMA
ncbi:MAG: hypothetical protein U0531_06465 [Dehalococcoidia bacterium]